MKAAGRRLIRPVTFVLLVLFGGCLGLAGRLTIATQQPDSADAVFVLSGDLGTSRLSTGIQQFRASGADRLVVFEIAPDAIYSQGADPAEFLGQHGVGRGAVRFVSPVGSTVDEAEIAAGLASRCGWTSVIVATSPYHTRRSGWLFRRAFDDGIAIRVVGSDDPFHPGTWFLHPSDVGRVLSEWGKWLLQSLPDLSPRASDVPC